MDFDDMGFDFEDDGGAADDAFADDAFTDDADDLGGDAAEPSVLFGYTYDTDLTSPDGNPVTASASAGSPGYYDSVTGQAVDYWETYK